MSITRYRNKVYVLTPYFELQLGVKYHTVCLWWRKPLKRIFATGELW